MLALGVREWENSGEKMRFFLKDVGANVRSHDRTYGIPCHNGSTALSPNVWLECYRETLFSPAIPWLLFPCYKVVL